MFGLRSINSQQGALIFHFFETMEVADLVMAAK
jgi:hypothetical protein